MVTRRGSELRRAPRAPPAMQRPAAKPSARGAWRSPTAAGGPRTPTSQTASVLREFCALLSPRPTRRDVEHGTCHVQEAEGRAHGGRVPRKEPDALGRRRASLGTLPSHRPWLREGGCCVPGSSPPAPLGCSNQEDQGPYGTARETCAVRSCWWQSPDHASCTGHGTGVRPAAWPIPLPCAAPGSAPRARCGATRCRAAPQTLPEHPSLVPCLCPSGEREAAQQTAARCPRGDAAPGASPLAPRRLGVSRAHTHQR